MLMKFDSPPHRDRLRLSIIPVDQYNTRVLNQKSKTRGKYLEYLRREPPLSL